MRQRGPLIAVIASGVLALLVILFLVLPKMGQVREAEDEMQAAQDSEVTLQAQLRSLQDAQAQAPQTEEEIRALEDEVPSTVDLPGLFRLLQSAADRAAVDFFQFSPGSPTPDASLAFSIVSSQIVITGSFFTLQEFLYSLETLPRAAKIMSVSIAPVGAAEATGTAVPASTGRLQMQMTVEFYTTDSSAGPGSQPGPTQGAAAAPAAAVDTTTTTTTTESGA